MHTMFESDYTVTHTLPSYTAVHTRYNNVLEIVFLHFYITNYNSQTMNNKTDKTIKNDSNNVTSKSRIVTPRTTSIITGNTTASASGSGLRKPTTVASSSTTTTSQNTSKIAISRSTTIAVNKTNNNATTTSAATSTRRKASVPSLPAFTKSNSSSRTPLNSQKDSINNVTHRVSSDNVTPRSSVDTANDGNTTPRTSTSSTSTPATSSNSISSNYDIISPNTQSISSSPSSSIVKSPLLQKSSNQLNNAKLYLSNVKLNSPISIANNNNLTSISSDNVDDIHTLKQQLQQSTNDNNQLKHQLNESNNTIQQRNNELSILKQSIETTNNGIDKSLSSEQIDNIQIANDNNRLKLIIQQLNNELSNIKSDNGSNNILQQQIDALNNDKQTLKEQCDKLTNDIHYMHSLVDACNAVDEQHTQYETMLNNEVDQLTLQCNELNNVVNQQNKQINQLNHTITKFRDKVKQLESNQKTGSTPYKTPLKQTVITSDQGNSHTSQQQLEQKLAELTTQLNYAQIQNQSMQSQYNDIKTTLEQRNNEITVLNNNLVQYEQIDNKLQNMANIYNTLQVQHNDLQLRYNVVNDKLKLLHNRQSIDFTSYNDIDRLRYNLQQNDDKINQLHNDIDALNKENIALRQQVNKYKQRAILNNTLVNPLLQRDNQSGNNNSTEVELLKHTIVALRKQIIHLQSYNMIDTINNIQYLPYVPTEHKLIENNITNDKLLTVQTNINRLYNSFNNIKTNYTVYDISDSKLFEQYTLKQQYDAVHLLNQIKNTQEQLHNIADSSTVSATA